MPLYIGILSGYLSGTYEAPIFSAVLSELRASGGSLVAIQTARPGSDYYQGVTRSDLAHVGWEKLAGFITVANAVSVDYLEALHAAGKPIVVIGNEEPGFACPSVLTDNAGGLRQAVEHLLAHGHRRIAFLGCPGQFDIRQRLDGYCQALRDHGVEPDPKLILKAENNYEHGAVSATRALLDAGLPSTAIVAATDLNAVGVIKTLKEAGLELPRDQAVIGFDNDPDSALLSPSLSSISQDLETIGTTAARFLVRLLQGGTLPSEPVVVPTICIVRESCGCARPWPEREHEAGGPKAPVAHAEAGPVEVFVSSLSRQCRNQQEVGSTIGHVRELARRIENVYLQAAEKELMAADLLTLSESCQELLVLVPGQATHEALSLLVGRLGSVPAGEQDQMAGAAERWGQCTAQARLTLSMALLELRNSMYYELRRTIRDEYLITLELLENEVRDPRLLHWLRSTDALAGVLALWREDKQVLDMVATYTAPGQELELVLGPVAVGSFPPDELLTGSLDPRLVCIFPLKSHETDWGFLAIAQPLGSRLLQEAHFSWSALFSEALDHQALLRSLSQRSADLDRSYQRERKLSQALRHQVLYDGLTGLPNRARFQERLGRAMARSRHGAHAYSVLWLDVDDFKTVNDTWGHLFADQLLVQVAKRLRSSLRRTDTAARFGGDEFLVLLESDGTHETDDNVVQRLSKHLEGPYEIEGKTVALSMSIGVAVGGPNCKRAEDLLQAADRAMYQDKLAKRLLVAQPTR